MRIVYSLLLLFFLNQTFAQQSLLFEISGNNLSQKSYLLATSQIRDSSLLYFHHNLFEFINDCDVFALEVDISEDGIIELQKAMFLPKGEYLYDLVDRRTYKELVSKIQKNTRLEESTIQHLKLFYAVSLATTNTMNNRDLGSINEALYAYAKSIGKPSIGIERIEDQLSYLDSLTNDELLSVLEMKDGQEIQNKEIVAYKSRNLDSLCSLSSKSSLNTFITKRNVNIAFHLDQLLPAKSVFLTLNYAHFCGDMNIVNLLEEKGYSVRPVDGKHQTINDFAVLKDLKQWKVYEDGLGKYRVMFPSPPQHQDQNMPTKSGEQLFMSTLMCVNHSESKAVYGLTFTLYPEHYKEHLKEEVVISKAVANYLNLTKGELVTSSEISYQYVKGREVSVKLNRENMYAHARFFYKEGVLYLLQVINNTSTGFNVKQQKFFNSFRMR